MGGLTLHQVPEVYFWQACCLHGMTFVSPSLWELFNLIQPGGQGSSVDYRRLSQLFPQSVMQHLSLAKLICKSVQIGLVFFPGTLCDLSPGLLVTGTVARWTECSGAMCIS